jgi:hypothetical protein
MKKKRKSREREKGEGEQPRCFRIFSIYYVRVISCYKVISLKTEMLNYSL